MGMKSSSLSPAGVMASPGMIAMAAEMPQATRLTTNSSGQVSWTFPTPFSAPPVISAEVLMQNTNQPYSIREISRTATGCSYQVLASPALAVALVGLTLLGELVAVGAGVMVDLVAKRATP